MQPVQRTQSLEEVLIARDASPRSASRTQPFTKLPFTQVSVADHTGLAAGASRSSYSEGPGYTSRRNLNVEQRVPHSSLVSAAPTEGPVADDGISDRSRGSQLSSAGQPRRQNAIGDIGSRIRGGASGGGASGSGGSALAALHVGVSGSGGTTAVRQLGPSLPRIVSNEALIVV